VPYIFPGTMSGFISRLQEGMYILRRRKTRLVRLSYVWPDKAQTNNPMGDGAYVRHPNGFDGTCPSKESCSSSLSDAKVSQSHFWEGKSLLSHAKTHETERYIALPLKELNYFKMPQPSEQNISSMDPNTTSLEGNDLPPVSPVIDRVLLVPCRKGVNRTVSEGGLCAYSGATSVREVIACCYETKKNLRKSRTNLRILMEESRQTLEDARNLKSALELMLSVNPIPEFSYEMENGNDTETWSEESVSEVSDMTSIEGL